jgi:hypothetical protein
MSINKYSLYWRRSMNTFSENRYFYAQAPREVMGLQKGFL